MDLKPVKSSMIAAVGHNPTANTLTVKFSSGPTWQYDGVTQEQYDDLLHAPSIGQAFAQRIKPKHKGRKLQ